MSSYFQFEYVNNRFSAKVFFQFFLPSCLTVNLTLRSADYFTVYAYRENSIHTPYSQMADTREKTGA